MIALIASVYEARQQLVLSAFLSFAYYKVLARLDLLHVAELSFVERVSNLSPTTPSTVNDSVPKPTETSMAALSRVEPAERSTGDFQRAPTPVVAADSAPRKLLVRPAPTITADPVSTAPTHDLPTTPSPTIAAPRAKSKSIDELLQGPSGGEPRSTAVALKPDLPDAPSRDETLAAMRAVEAAVRACAGTENLEGKTAEVAINVAGISGRVTSATLTGITGTVGSCIARAVRSARFPRFSKPAFSIKYPYRF